VTLGDVPCAGRRPPRRSCAESPCAKREWLYKVGHWGAALLPDSASIPPRVVWRCSRDRAVAQ